MSGDAGEAKLQSVLTQLQRRRPAAAERAIDALPPVMRRLPAWTLLRGVTQTRLGRIDAACDILRPLLRQPEPWAGEGTAALADALHLGQRLEDLQALLVEAPGWAATPRGRLFEARTTVRTDPARALGLLMAIVDGTGAPELQRLAGFDAVKLLDRQARYRDAHALALRLHASTPPFEIDAFLARMQLQQKLLVKGAKWCPPRAEPVDDVALIVGLPRSGTTLLEQMLDAHPDVAGIGEHEGMADTASALVAAGVWPYRLAHLPAETAAAMQRNYRGTARQRITKAARWTLDKSLLTWQWLPALAAVMPGAVALHLVRDPRDTAISAFLSPLDPEAFGWVADFEMMRKVIETERTLVPLALKTLGIAHETLVYESLVADPSALIEPVLQRLGLSMDARVLSPEANARTAVTLSHEQVRRPINDSAIGRWQHYEFAFDAGWDGLAAAHAAARA